LPGSHHSLGHGFLIFGLLVVWDLQKNDEMGTFSIDMLWLRPGGVCWFFRYLLGIIKGSNTPPDSS